MTTDYVDPRRGSRTFTTWLPQGEYDYLMSFAKEQGISRNGAFRRILEQHQRNAERRAKAQARRAG
jgi:hypothetical protein